MRTYRCDQCGAIRSSWTDLDGTACDCGGMLIQVFEDEETEDVSEYEDEEGSEDEDY